MDTHMLSSALKTDGSSNDQLYAVYTDEFPFIAPF